MLSLLSSISTFGESVSSIRLGFSLVKAIHVEDPSRHHRSTQSVKLVHST